MQIAFLVNVKNFKEFRVFHSFYNNYRKKQTFIMYNKVPGSPISKKQSQYFQFKKKNPDYGEISLYWISMKITNT